jgi:hypothetical protein
MMLYFAFEYIMASAYLIFQCRWFESEEGHA